MTRADSHLFSRENSWFLLLFSELTVTNIAHFSVLAILTVHLVDALSFTPAETALVLLSTSIGLRFSRVALAPFIDRFSPRRVIPAAILVSLIGYLGMTQATTAPMAALCMLLVGTGYGLNGMLVTTLASYAARHATAFPMYALMNTGTNLAAAAAPPVSNWLRLEVSPEAPFLFSAFALVVSFAMSLRIRSDIPAAYTGMRFSRAVWPLLKTPRFLALMALVAAGWAVYTQKFAATPLFINSALQAPATVGTAVSVNALIVLLLSLPAASYIRFHGISGRRVLALAFALYAAAYATLALSPDFYGLWTALIIWSLGETLLMPQLNALVAAATKAEDRLAGFSLSAVAIGVGEAAGNAGGVALLAFTLATGDAWLAYALLAVVCVVTCVAALAVVRREA